MDIGSCGYVSSVVGDAIRHDNPVIGMLDLGMTMFDEDDEENLASLKLA